MRRSIPLRTAIALATTLCATACSTLHNPAPSTMDRRADGKLGRSADDTPTQHQDAQRTGAYLDETTLTPARVGSGRFGRLFDWQVDGQLYAQPLYLSQVPFPDGTKKNVVIAATTNNSVYAFEAPTTDQERPVAKSPLWHVDSSQLGRALPYDFFLIDWGILGHNLKPKIGITATPVVDRERGLVYVSVKTGFGKPWSWLVEPQHRLFAIDLTAGAVVAGVNIEASAPGRAGDLARFDPKHQLQRASLLEANGRIYLAFASHQDTAPYHGWILAYDAQTLKPVASYCTTCEFTDSSDCVGASCGGGIWQAGTGPASDPQGNVYVMTGNGDFDPDTVDRANSFVKLDKDLRPTGSWTPANFDCLNPMDADLGSAGPTFLSGSSVLVGGGKQGVLYALSPAALGGTQVQPGHEGTQAPCDESDPVPQPNSGPGDPKYWSIQASRRWEPVQMNVLRLIDPSSQTLGYHHIHGAPAQWTLRTPSGERTLLYVSAERDELRAYEFKDGFVRGADPDRDPVDTFHSLCRNSEMGMPGGFLTVSAERDRPDSGIVWVAMPRRNHDALNDTVPGVLRAYEAYPSNGATLREIWNSDSGTSVPVPPGCADPGAAGADALGDHAKFAPPTVAEGKVYVGTFSNRLVVYGLRATPGGAPDLSAEWAPLKLSDVVDTGTEVGVELTATNRGSETWRPGDGIRLGSPTSAQEKVAPVEGESALRLAHDVAPGESYTFHFHVTAPAEEGHHHVTWRLARNADPTQALSGEWFGPPTAEWSFDTLKPDPQCVDLRAHAADYVARIRVDSSVAQTDGTAIRALVDEAAGRGCSLRERAATH